MRKKLIAIVLTVVCIICFGNLAFAQRPYNEKNHPAQIRITVKSCNVRSGPSTSNRKVFTGKKGQVFDCVGKVGNWYVVYLENNIIGMISGDCAAPLYKPTPSKPVATKAPTPVKTPAPAKPPAEPSSPSTPALPPVTSTPAEPSIPSVTGLTADEQSMFDMINNERVKNGLAKYSINMELVKVARIKAQDMVSNNYFSHQSPTYGSPFDMMKKFGISYRAAGENIAQNSTVSGAHTSLMNSPGHRANILSGSFNQIGIGIVAGPGKNKTFVQMFIQK